MSKQFKEGSDFDEAAKVLLSESTEDTLNESLASDIMNEEYYKAIVKGLDTLESNFQKNSPLYKRLKRANVKDLDKKFSLMQKNLSLILTEWVKIENNLRSIWR